MVLALGLSLVEFIRSRHTSNNRVHWILPALFLYYLTSELLSGGDWSSLEKRLILVAIPLAILAGKNFDTKNIKAKASRSYVAGTLLACVICLARAVIRSFSYVDGEWRFNAKVVEGTEYDFLTSSVMGGNYFFTDEFSFMHHTTYFGIFILFAQYLLFEIYTERTRSRTSTLLYGLANIFFSAAIFLLSSKAVILTFILLSLWILLRIRMLLRTKILILTLFFVVGAAFALFNPRLRILEQSLRNGIAINPTAAYGHDLRLLSWDASLTIIRESLPWGVGEANKLTALLDVYHKKGYITPEAQKHNSHNQYLDFLIGGGIIGLSLFLGGMVHVGWCSILKRNVTLQVFLFIFLFNAMFENLLSRHSGILFFSIFLGLLTLRNEQLSTGNNVDLKSS
jgi:hypothetical protein